MSATKFFVYPFGTAGTLTPVLDPIQPGGVISYQEGFGVDYTLEYGVDPAALPIPQGGMNQLFFDITTALQQYQTIGTPNFVTASQNLGTAYPYLVNAYALWTDGNIYQALANNSVTPTDPTNWRLCNNNAAKIILPNRVFEGTVVSGNTVYWNAGTSQFTKAIANGTSAQLVVGIADVTNKRVYVSGDVAIMSGLTPGSQYYLSTVTTGSITAIAPITNAVPIGVAISATELLLSINTFSPSPNNRYVGASLYMSAPQSVSTFSPLYTILNFDTVISGAYDPWSLTGTPAYSILAPISGFYLVSANVSFATSVSCTMVTGVAVNGVTVPNILFKLAQNQIGAAGTTGANGMTVVKLNIGDYVQIAMTLTFRNNYDGIR